jgi:hypothetical protein
LWEAAIRSGNHFLACGDELAQAAALPVFDPDTAAPVALPVLRAPGPPGNMVIDGHVGEWPWADKERVVKADVTPGGDVVMSPTGTACAARDGTMLYIATRFEIPRGARLQPAANWGGDGVEVSFRDGTDGGRGPIYVLWGTLDGTFNTTAPRQDASAKQLARLRAGTRFAAATGEKAWTCEWALPLKDMGIDPAKAGTLHGNIGFRSMSDDRWVAWVATGGAFWQVGDAGVFKLE